jgi:hypothetical protein
MSGKKSFDKKNRSKLSCAEKNRWTKKILSKLSCARALVVAWLGWAGLVGVGTE